MHQSLYFYFYFHFFSLVDWGVRLYKATLSTKLFRLYDEYLEMRGYGRWLLDQGSELRYGSKNYSDFFIGDD